MSFSTIKKAATFSLILVAFAMFVGCGGDEAQVKSTAKKFVSAMEKGDLDKMADCLCKDAKAKFNKSFDTGDKKTDEAAKKMATDMMKEMAKEADIKFGAVKIDGDKAKLESTSKNPDGKEESDEIPFVKEDGKWLIAEFM